MTALLSSSPQAEIALALQQPDLVEPLFFPLQPQPLPAMPGAYVFDGAIDEWPAQALLQTTPQHRDAVDAQAWLAADSSGLNLAARLPPGDDVTLILRIASMDRLTLPPVGWLQRFVAPHYYRSADDCAFEHPENLQSKDGEARCREWFAQQAPHRAAVADSFVRQWRITPAGRSEERAILQELKPDGALAVRAAPPDATERTLELKLPWNAWPATDQLDLTRLYTQLSLCRGGHCQILQRDQEEPGVRFNTWTLATPQRYAVACGFPLQGTSHPRVQDFSHGYFLPGSETTVSRVLALRLPAASYQDDPDGLSPEITAIDYAALPLDDKGAFLCGPPVSYRKGDTLRRTEASWVAPPTHFFAIDDGNVLAVTDVIDHPTITGMGQGGGCPARSIEAFYIDLHSGEITASGMGASPDCAEDYNTAELSQRTAREIVGTYHSCTYEQVEPAASTPTQGGTADRSVFVCRKEEVVNCLKPGERAFVECERRELEVTHPDASSPEQP
ncbi:hypothetical protein [Tahibacter harae]|uniref:Uncharacterized protein n=1 Tax=Tahibacter harae TaxID=2963937 RepID=A0ABT1QUY8_9GAMM|nr:hypothetical protein [Tahibacter harae]MCQ4166086.1 hypothetical protein [Tahibacter harae]